MTSSGESAEFLTLAKYSRCSAVSSDDHYAILSIRKTASYDSCSSSSVIVGSLHHRQGYGARHSNLSSLLKSSNSGSPSDGTARAARGFPASSVKRSIVP